jgi:hypothetical protein
MKVVRKFAVQGHPVPESAHSPVGPFPPEVLAGPKVEYGNDHSDSLHEAFDTVRLFRCRDCDDVLYGEQLNNHTCEEI